MTVEYFHRVGDKDIPFTDEEVIERQAEEKAWADSQAAYKPPIGDTLNQLFQTLPDESQADLAPLKAAVVIELQQGRNNIAKLIIERAQIPAELEPLRTQMLNHFE